MLCLTNIYDDILNDFSKKQYSDLKRLFRILNVNHDITVLISVEKNTKQVEVSFSIKKYDEFEIKRLPKWKGMDQVLYCKNIDGEDQTFLSFIKTPDYDTKIYFLVVQDILNELYVQDNENTFFKIKKVLEKWKYFFQYEKKYLISDNVQQGLFGELYILNKFIDKYGEKCLSCWTGCNEETHDFYFGNDAVEIKSSSTKGIDKLHISNEYQLDDSKLIGKLYLIYLKIKKSEVYGNTLSQLVNIIVGKLSYTQKNIFYEKLLKVGYLYQLPELYTTHFSINDESCYHVVEGFPRIIKGNVPKGINSINYIINLDVCEKFLYSIEKFYEEVGL